MECLMFLSWNQRLKNAIIPKYHHQMVFHVTVPSNILNDMAKMPLGTLGIKFGDSKMFIRRNRLNRLMSHKLKYTNQTILYAFDIYQQRFLIEWGFDIFIFLPHIFHTDTVLADLTMGLKTRLNWLVKTALFICFKLNFQYPSYWNEPITVCGFIQ